MQGLTRFFGRTKFTACLHEDVISNKQRTWIKGIIVVPEWLCVCTHFAFQSPCFFLGGTEAEWLCQAGRWWEQSLRAKATTYPEPWEHCWQQQSMTRLGVKGWMAEPNLMLVLSCVCQGWLSWVWEKLGCFASLTLEHGDELIKPHGVTFTLDKDKYIFHFLVSIFKSESLWSREAHLKCCTEAQLLGPSDGASQVLLAYPVHGEPWLPHLTCT